MLDRIRQVGRSWFQLTRSEQFSVLLVLGIFLVGLVARLVFLQE